MPKHSASTGATASPTWDSLETFARTQIQHWVQTLLEAEVTELVGRTRYERRVVVDAAPIYRNGRGKPRKLTTSSGTIELRRPRVRGLTERFESRVLPLFKRQTQQVDALLPELYLHGLAEGDFDLALRGLLGTDAPLSASSVARLKAAWQAEYDTWRQRDLADLEPVYIWADGIYVKAGLEKDKAAILVLIAALRDGRKVVLAVEPGERESTASWSALLRRCKQQGLRCPKLVLGDGHLGLWGALANVFPDAAEQRCWNHKIRNVLDKLPKRVLAEARALLTPMPYAATARKAGTQRDAFVRWCTEHAFDRAASALTDDWDRMVAFYAFPAEHWKHLRTTNIVESPFAAVRLRTGAAKRYKKVRNATAVIWKTLLLAERRFRKLDGAHLLGEVAEGATYKDGKRVTGPAKKASKSKVPA